jgi:hypothetical protein
MIASSQTWLNSKLRISFCVEVFQPKVNVGAEALHRLDGQRPAEVFGISPEMENF